MAYRKNPEATTQGKNMGTNIVIGQDQLEGATFEQGIPVQTGDAKTRVVAKAVQTAPYKAMNAGSTIRNNAGVIMPVSDKTGIDTYPGKAGGTKT